MRTPERIMQFVSGYWSTAILVAAVEHSVFTHVECGRSTPEAIAKAAGISERGARALCDGLVALGLLARSEDATLRNAPDASEFLVEGKDSYMGGLARRAFGDFDLWKRLPEVVRTGEPGDTPRAEIEDSAHWDSLIFAIAPMAAPAANAVVHALDFAARGKVRVLDVGGGSGMFSATLLRANPQARAVQVDWPRVNRAAKRFVVALGVGNRFDTVDGDLHAVELGEGVYDVAIYSNIAHQESPAQNRVLLQRLRRALRPGGSLVVSDFLVNDDRTGPPFSLLFALQMLLETRGGSTYTERDYRSWMEEAGFSNLRIVPAGGSTLVIGNAG
jgi:SAM-dependent methyltransferase